jgi:hypothetical protein
MLMTSDSGAEHSVLDAKLGAKRHTNEKARFRLMKIRTVTGRSSTGVASHAWRPTLAALCAGGLISGCTEAPAPDSLQARADQQWPMLDRYCVDCHNSIDFTADIAFDEMSPDAIAHEAETWERVVRQLRSRTMPPPGGPRPASVEVDGFVAWMEASLDEAASFDPGHVELHRLNRTEYVNAVEDLLAVDVDPEILPVDDIADGFDNIARALQVSPSFIEQYLDAARTVSAQALGNPFPRAVGVPYSIPADGQQFHVEGLPLGTRGGALIEHYFPSDGEYLLNIGDLATGFSYTYYEHTHTLIATLDGKKLFQLDVGGGEDSVAVDQERAPAAERLNSRLKSIPFTATAGVHRIGVTFLHRSFAESDRVLHSQVPGTGNDAVLRVSLLEIFGPVEPAGLSSTPSREKIFICYPKDETEHTACAAEIVTRLAGRAFRGQSSDEDIARFMRLFEIGAVDGEFEEGIKYALSGVLAHPKFLYRFEPAPDDSAPASTYALSSVELASRLSFFLWSTIPDAELLEVAASDGLKDPVVLEQQVRRMLADSRSETLASNFAYQWLGLGKLDSLAPDPFLFGDVGRNIRALFVDEARLFIDSIFREDRSVLDLLTADHTYLNGPLALHYGINDIRGARFRRVQLADESRRGLLGKGGVLLASSYPNRTSPVLRGAWVLEKILGTHPPQPPPGVEGLAENIEGEAATTVRERLEAHRSNPDCNGCHGILDPMGFALEGFDAVGRWREMDREAGTPIDSSGVLADGTEVDGPVALRTALLKRPEQLVQTLVERLMTYGLGRSLDYRDMPTVRRIVREAAAEDFRFRALIWGIVSSDPFQRKSLPTSDAGILSARTAREE